MPDRCSINVPSHEFLIKPPFFSGDDYDDDDNDDDDKKSYARTPSRGDLGPQMGPGRPEERFGVPRGSKVCLLGGGSK